MKKKQVTGIVIAGIVFVAVGFFGVMSNYLAGKFADKGESSVSSFNSMMKGLDKDAAISLPLTDYIGVVDVQGTIQASSGSDSLFSAEGYDHTLNMKFIDKMMDSDTNKGIVLYVDSPGGTVYESDELYLKLMEYKEQTGRPIWAYFGPQACSGGYYISMAADRVYANRNCWTGSIGVIISLTNYKGLYDKLGIKETDITSGPNKAMGSGGIDMTEEQEAIMQSMVDEAYDQFVEIVADGRGMDDAAVRKLADGRIYTAKQALENGLIDVIADYESMQADMEDSLEGVSITYYTPQKDDLSSLFSSLFSAYQGTKEKSDAQVINEMINDKKNGELMYYAE